MNTAQEGNGESRLETGISFLLMAGVTISLVLELIGIVLFYRAFGNLAVSQEQAMFISGNNFFSLVLTQFQRSGVPDATRFLTAGVIVLILTPFMWLVSSVLYFALQKNVRYVLINIFVLTVVTLSLLLH